VSERNERASRFEDSLRDVAGALRRAEVGHGARWLLYCAIVGAVAGCAALAFEWLSSAGVRLMLERVAGWTPGRPGGEDGARALSGVPGSLWLLALVPAVGGLLSGALVAWLAPEASGHGTDAAIDAYHNRGGLIRPRVPLVKILASAITLGSGGSGGREGPIAQAGAGFGSFIAGRLRLSRMDRRVLLAAGMGAGIGSIFRAPLAGALFAAEILYATAEFEASVLIPACVSSIIAYAVFTLVHGPGTVFETPELAFGNPLELVAYFALALVLVAYGYAYVRALYGAHEAFRRWRAPAALKPAIGGLATGAIAVALYLSTRNTESLSVLGFGYGVIQHVLDAPHSASLGAGLLALIAVGKIATTSATIGSGGSAGVFGPSMVIGGCAGGAVGLLLHQQFPDVVREPASFVVVGMAGFFSGIAKTPISSLVMVSEITGSYSLLVPSMWVCVLTFSMSRGWCLYSKQVPARVDSPAHQGRFAIDVLRGMRVAEALRTASPVQSLRAADPLTDVLRVARGAQHETLPVLGANGALVGLIALEDVRGVMDEKLPERIVAHDLMRTEFPRLSPADDLARALRALSATDLEELPVWDDHARAVLGMISRRQLTRMYVERVAELQETLRTA